MICEMTGRSDTRAARRRRSCWAALAILQAGAAGALAQDIGEQQVESLGLARPNFDGWQFTIGGGVGVGPKYEGSRSYGPVPLPFVSITYDQRLSLSSEGLKANLLPSGDFKAGPLLGYFGGRNESDDSAALHGLSNIQPSLTAGAFASYELRPFEISGTIRQAVIHTGNGLEAELAASYGLMLFDRLGVKIGPEITFADDTYTKTFFGVTSAQSMRSGLHVFTPRGGVKDVGINLGGNYDLTENWLLRGIASIKELVGDAGSSPIVHSRTEVFGGFGVAYRF
jgi:outer membrane scaffolding protein for murein synthesis (MipA/OmpV family)